ncbi:Peptidase family M50 [Poriferisphaera corsica]|uniref:Peptidase family M50 n=1 Tax=Poriferisphaera corsica TaxID=2528020 RepID=A0A517YTN9_9BACT|nr:site-2 protease family protein [Poriferisphaera corsica]QDU33591.1 Peptidase family M50 [Poriferisphaera corsica]
MDIFISYLFSPETRFLYFSWVVIVVISIVLHELAHGLAAIKCGDDTPVRLGRMTANPLVHMGPFSLFALFVMGIAWGAMPIDPSKLRGKYAEAYVAMVGPLTNVSIAMASLVVGGLLVRFNLLLPDPHQTQRLLQFLLTAGYANLFLAAFNLFPIPPLDGAHVLANYSRGYATLVSDPSKQGIWIIGFIFAVAVSWEMTPYFYDVAASVFNFVAVSGM